MKSVIGYKRKLRDTGRREGIKQPTAKVLQRILAVHCAVHLDLGREEEIYLWGPEMLY